MTEYKSIAVVGAGLVGPLQALFLAQAGFEVHVYDKRSDFRGTSEWKLLAPNHKELGKSVWTDAYTFIMLQLYLGQCL